MGDVIVVDPGTSGDAADDRVLTLVDVTVEPGVLANPGDPSATFDVSGTAPAGPVSVWVDGSGGGCGYETTASSPWDLRFINNGVDGDPGVCDGFSIEADTQVHEARVPDGDGDFTVTRPPDPPEPPSISASVLDDWVAGNGLPAFTAMAVTVDHGAGAVSLPAVSTDSNGQFGLWDLGGEDLLVGDVIVVDPGTSGDAADDRVLTLVDVTVEPGVLANPGDPSATFDVSGTAPAGPVSVWVDGSGGGCGYETTASSPWDLRFINNGVDGDPGVCDGFSIEADTQVNWVGVPDGDGDFTVTRPPEPPSISASVLDDWVAGNGLPAFTAMAVTVDHGAGAVSLPAVSTDSNGQFNLDDLGGEDLLVGDVIVVDPGTSGDAADDRVLTLVDVTVEPGVLANPGDPSATFDVSGTAPAGPVRVSVGDEVSGCDYETTASSPWTLRFINNGVDGDPGVCEGFSIEADTRVHEARVPDGDGDFTVTRPPDPPEPPSISASVLDDWVAGNGLPAFTAMAVTVDHGAGAVSLPAVSTDSNGQFGLWDLGGEDLLVGDVIVVDPGTSGDAADDRVLTLVDVTVEPGVLANPGDPSATFDVSGTAPAGPVSVWVDGSGGGCGYETTASSPWDLRFINNGVDGDPGVCDGFSIEADTQVNWVGVPDGDGDFTVTRPPEPPSISASVLDDWVAGNGLPAFTAMAVTVDHGAGAVSLPAVSTDSNGQFNLDDLGGEDLLVGDVIVVDPGTSGDAADDRVLTLVDVTVEPGVLANPGDPSATFDVSGTAPAGPVSVEVGNDTSGCGYTVSASSPWDLRFINNGVDGDPGVCDGFSIEADTQVNWVGVPDDDGDFTVTRPPDPPGLTVLSSPCVVYDTNGAGESPFVGGETRTVQVTGTLTGQGGAASCVPVGVSSVVFRISSVDPLTEGNLLMTPAGVASTGSAGVVNYGAGNGLNNANTVTVPVSAAGAVDVGANTGPAGPVPTTDVRLVAVGFYSPEVVPELKFFAVNPCAVADSRTNQGASDAFNGPNNDGLWPVNGAFPDIDVVGVFDAGQGGGNGVTGCGVPAGADAVMVNVVAVNMVGGSGHLSVGTGGSDPINEATTPFAVLTPKMNNGATTIVNLNGGQTIALDIDGNALASTMIRVEILGYYDQDVAGLDFVDVTPCAVFDTRSNKGATGGFAGERLNGLANTTTYQIAGRSVPVGQGGIVDTGGGTGTCGVPDGASAVLINLEAVNAVREGNFWVSATGTTTTGGVLNFNNVTPKMNNANAVVVPLSTAGQLDLEVNAGTFTPDDTPIAQARGVILGYYIGRAG